MLFPLKSCAGYENITEEKECKKGRNPFPFTDSSGSK